MSAREDYIRSLYGGSSSGSPTGTSGGAVGGYTPGGGSGTNYGSNVNTTSGVGTNVSGIADTEHYKYITDPKLDEDEGVYQANQTLFDTLKDTYTSPTDTYGTGSGLDFVTVDAGTVDDLGFFDERIGDEKNPLFLSDELLKFYGVDPNAFGIGSGSLSIPKELYQMIAEGSIVTPMEAMNPAQIKGYDKDGNVISVDEDVGTFSDLEAGVHPLLGSINKYYGIMSGSSFPQPATGGGGGSITPGGGGSSYGAYLGAGMPMSPKQLGDAEKVPGQLRLLQYMVNVHRGNPYTKMAMRKKDGGLASIVGD